MVARGWKWMAVMVMRELFGAMELFWIWIIVVVTRLVHSCQNSLTCTLKIYKLCFL